MSLLIVISPPPPIGNLTLSDRLDPNDNNLTVCTEEKQLTLADFQGKGTCFTTGNYSLEGSLYQNHCLFPPIELKLEHSRGP